MLFQQTKANANSSVKFTQAWKKRFFSGKFGLIKKITR
jgi:hypothetical protein